MNIRSKKKNSRPYSFIWLTKMDNWLPTRMVQPKKLKILWQLYFKLILTLTPQCWQILWVRYKIKWQCNKPSSSISNNNNSYRLTNLLIWEKKILKWRKSKKSAKVKMRKSKIWLKISFYSSSKCSNSPSKLKLELKVLINLTNRNRFCPRILECHIKFHIQWMDKFVKDLLKLQAKCIQDITLNIINNISSGIGISNNNSSIMDNPIIMETISIQLISDSKD